MTDYKSNISKSGLTIYDVIPIGHPDLWIPSTDLEILLNNELIGKSLHGLPLRSRSKVLKQFVCEALGYPVPKSFQKTRPRFIGQNFDTYGQKSNNLQIWNEELSADRRYVLIKIDEVYTIRQVKVVIGEVLAFLDTTGRLTQKYQARLLLGDEPSELVSAHDTKALSSHVNDRANQILAERTPVSYPVSGELLPIRDVYYRLLPLLGHSFSYSGHDQERNRGGALQEAVCNALGYRSYSEDGQFPDIKHQLLEVKLQTSPTIDLGLVRPNSEDLLDVPMMNGFQVRHCDTRYAMFYASVAGETVTLTHLYVTTGEAFFTRFPACEGLVLNKKLQIPLPQNFFG